MSFLDIKDTAERKTLVKEYVAAMKTVKQRNMMNREMKLTIGDELLQAGSSEFDRFLNDLENLYAKIKYENPYAMFFTGDFNAHSQNWWPEGNTNNEGITIENLSSALDHYQIIREATHFEEKQNPSCIDLISSDQPNIIVGSGVRPSLDPFCKHQIIYCNINFNMPSAHHT